MMRDKQSLHKVLITAVLCGVSTVAAADWSLNIGYHNPPQAGLGVNFLFAWPQFGLELGIGNVDSNANFDRDEDNRNADDDGVGLGIAGDVNGKLFFLKSSIRPYIQVGTLLGTYGALGDHSGLGLGSGGVFFGGGLWFGQVSSVHGYLSYNLINGWDFIQAGLGFDI